MISTPEQPLSVSTQVEALRRKLLDLSLRNRMLNYRPSKRLGITVVGEDSVEVYRLLVQSGKRLTFVGKPDPPPKVQSPPPQEILYREDQLAMAEFRAAAEDELDAFLENPVMPIDQLDTKLNTEDFESVLQAKLRTIHREAQLANDELGINTLFLTLGALEWVDAEERSHRAPLLFVPATLIKQSNGSMRLAHDGSDVGVNLPLQAKLSEFGLKLPVLDDEMPIYEYFSQIETTLKSRGTWQVHRNEVSLGFFNYEKYAMYVDLGGENWPEGKKPWQHVELVQMLGSGYAPTDSPITERTMVDDFRPIQSCHEVFDADSSQTLAMIRAAEGLSIVIQGPPGTGKSQTITNIIAEAVAAGKSVLFVSAKRAALEVVKRNLGRADLGDICLDLHDKLTNRREFYSEIKRTASKSLTLRSEEEKVARLTELRAKLNAHSSAVNEPLEQFGMTPFSAMSLLAQLPPEAPEDREGRISFEKLQHIKATEVNLSLPQLRALQQRLQAVGVPTEHPFWGTAINYLDPAKRMDLEEDLTSAKEALTEAQHKMQLASDLLCIKVPQTPATARVLRACVERALSAPAHEGVDVKTETWKAMEPQIRAVIHSLERKNNLRSKHERVVKPEIWTADLSLVAKAYEELAGAWYKFLSGRYRFARQQLDGYLQPEATQDPLARRDLLRDVLQVQEDERLINAAGDLQRLYGVQWRGLDSDPKVLAKLLGWILDVHASVGTGQIPSGLLDFLSGTTPPASASTAVEQAEMATELALSKYQQVSELLVFQSSGCAEEPWSALLERVMKWRDNLPRLSEFMAYSEARRQALESGLGPAVEIADRWPLAADRLENTYLRSYYIGVVREAMHSRPELRTFERAGHEAAIKEFQSLDDFKLKYNRAQVRIAHHRRIPSFDNALGNLNLLRIQCELQRGHKPIRWIMARAGEAIQRIKPVFMMSPLSVAIHLPTELPPFDLVIFDEASQIKPEDAICSIIRAKQAIVVGDTKQMPPSSFFDRLAADDEELEDDSIEAELGQEARKLESVLSLMSAVTIGRVRQPDLRWHYRSVHPSLIQPSNEMFYDGRLVVFPSPGTFYAGRRIGVVFHHHPDTVYEGGSKNRVNRQEAKIVADQVVEHLRRHPDESLLVAAMNKPQADLIYDEVAIRERMHPELFGNYSQKHPHEPLDIKNLENVQGDERDVVFISVTYGRDDSGKLRQHFGPLLQEGGERRLNVLVTRARRRCEVFSNITADDIRLDTPRRGVESLKRYLRFAQSGRIDLEMPTGGEEESPFEEEVTSALRDYGFEYDCQIGSEGFRIDIGVIDPEKPGRYLLGIECDGATYHSARSARDRDKLRQRVLENRGWRLHRIWSNDWWQDRDTEIHRLLEAIKSARQDAAEEPDEDENSHEIVLEEGVRQATAEGRTRPYELAPVPEIMTEADLDNYFMDLVRIEGPIHEDLLFARLRAATGYARAGANVKSWINKVIERNRPRVKFAADGYYLDDRQYQQARDWSARPAGEKKADLVSELELAAALRTVVGQAFGITRDDAAKAAYTLLGFKRVVDAATVRALKVVVRMVLAGGLVEKDLLLYLPAEAK